LTSKYTSKAVQIIKTYFDAKQTNDARNSLVQKYGTNGFSNNGSAIHERL